MISDLFPFKINSAVIKNGSVHFRAYKKETPVDVYLTQFNATIDNLGNIRDETNPLVSTDKRFGPGEGWRKRTKHAGSVSMLSASEGRE